MELRVVAEPAVRRPRQEPRLRFYTAEGQPLLHVDELSAFHRAEETARLRMEWERQREDTALRRAEQREARERAAREAAEQRERVERAARKAAEQQLADERAARLEHDRRFAALEAQVARLRAGGLPLVDDSVE